MWIVVVIFIINVFSKALLAVDLSQHSTDVSDTYTHSSSFSCCSDTDCSCSAGSSDDYLLLSDSDATCDDDQKSETEPTKECSIAITAGTEPLLPLILDSASSRTALSPKQTLTRLSASLYEKTKTLELSDKILLAHRILLLHNSITMTNLTRCLRISHASLYEGLSAIKDPRLQKLMTQQQYINPPEITGIVDITRIMIGRKGYSLLPSGVVTLDKTVCSDYAIDSTTISERSIKLLLLILNSSSSRTSLPPAQVLSQVLYKLQKKSKILQFAEKLLLAYHILIIHRSVAIRRLTFSLHTSLCYLREGLSHIKDPVLQKILASKTRKSRTPDEIRRIIAIAKDIMAEKSTSVEQAALDPRVNVAPTTLRYWFKKHDTLPRKRCFTQQPQTSISLRMEIARDVLSKQPGLKISNIFKALELEPMTAFAELRKITDPTLQKTLDSKVETYSADTIKMKIAQVKRYRSLGSSPYAAMRKTKMPITILRHWLEIEGELSPDSKITEFKTKENPIVPLMQKMQLAHMLLFKYQSLGLVRIALMLGVSLKKLRPALKQMEDDQELQGMLRRGSKPAWRVSELI